MYVDIYILILYIDMYTYSILVTGRFTKLLNFQEVVRGRSMVLPCEPRQDDMKSTFKSMRCVTDT